MEDQQVIEKAKTVVTQVSDNVKTLNASLPGGLIIGFGAGFLWKGLTGAIIGGVVGATIYKIYESNQEK